MWTNTTLNCYVAICQHVRLQISFLILPLHLSSTLQVSLTCHFSTASSHPTCPKGDYSWSLLELFQLSLCRTLQVLEQMSPSVHSTLPGHISHSNPWYLLRKRKKYNLYIIAACLYIVSLSYQNHLQNITDTWIPELSGIAFKILFNNHAISFAKH